ncbi:hypothetical protein ACMU_06340 [Actibacterium mucosum KCTC 23349]|uniref:DNA-binding protein H-NS-like C-terminal domain-containing protein n=1 Tax=Actibacterium mucosum KCTC 23349 TaxID=1454373 RepID=A0A037ZLY6_9RHOB|nr:H-NS histone family protein [Actibacterium mucosum]KAJ56557.1 hypothetical protein ACMU_06340 [Actibacterium mucosum KCTC 23349]
MPTTINLDALSLAELKDLQKDVAKAITSFEDRKRKEALSVLEEKAREMGFSLNDLTKGGKKSALPPKYRNPENPDQTWSGRGRKPLWFSQAMAAGRDVAEFEI